MNNHSCFSICANEWWCLEVIVLTKHISYENIHCIMCFMVETRKRQREREKCPLPPTQICCITITIVRKTKKKKKKDTLQSKYYFLDLSKSKEKQMYFIFMSKKIINRITHNFDNKSDFQDHHHLVNQHRLNDLIVLNMLLVVFYLIYVLLHDDFETKF